jgi:hypothetical protein
MFSLYGLDNRSWKQWQKVTRECQRRLTEQSIVPGNPGTILTDIDILIGVIGPGGLVTRSRNATFPAERLPELNAKISHPIELPLKRALLRDYPNLAGLFILLRVMDLLQMAGNRLVLCPTALEFWRSLNPTEQYFALLEALLFHAHSSVLCGEDRCSREDARACEAVTLFLGQLSDHWLNFDHYASVYVFGPRGQLRPWNLFVQQQLGLIELRPSQASEGERRYSSGGRGWLVGGAKRTSWGTSVTWALLGFLKQEIEAAEAEGGEAVSNAGGQQLEIGAEILSLASDPATAEPKDNSRDLESAEEDMESDEAPNESAMEAEFGILQPVFQPYFPEWQTVYARPKRQARTGTHIFKVSIGGWRGGGGVWRRLAVPPDLSLDSLARAILRAFNFDDDHLYDFRYRDQRGKSRVYNHPETDEGPFTHAITVGKTGLALKDEMLFTFDYGDDWKFRVRLEKIEAGSSRLRQAKVVESAGKAPEQYPDSDW